MTLEEVAIFTTLVFIEVILGIDNIVVLAVLVDRLKEEQKTLARAIGLGMAYILRIVFVLIALNIKNMEATTALFGLDIPISSALFGLGGLFLVLKGCSEIRQLSNEQYINVKPSGGFYAVIFQIMFIDLVFSFDSVLTAVALTSNEILIILAITIAILTMFFTSGLVASLIAKFDRLKLLALLFVVLVGVYLILEAFHLAFDRTYLFAMIAFSIMFETTGYFILSQKK